MFNFAWPWFALLLPLPWMLRRFWPGRGLKPPEPETGPLLLNPSVARLQAAFLDGAPHLTPPGLAPLAQHLLTGIVWVGLVVALMRPQWLEQHTEVVSSGYDLMLAVDTSHSMDALDFTLDGREVTRLAVVKGVVGRFIEQRHGDRIGLIVFGDNAYLQAPLTLDGAAVRTMLDAAVPGMVGDATAVGDAVGLAVKKLRDRPPGSRVLVLLTDGENTAGIMPPEQAILLARHYGIRLYAVGVGSKGKVPIIEHGRRVEKDMQIDEELLQRMAALTHGAYFRATDAQALEEIYRRIDALEKTEAETRTTLVPQPLFRWPLAVCLGGLLLLGALSVRRGWRF